MHVGIRADEGANTWAMENRTTQIRHLVRMLSILSAARLGKLTNSQQKAQHHAWLSPVVFDLI